MLIGFDPKKNERNIAARGASFELADEIEWDGALVVEDTRKDYGGRRFQALGTMAGRLHALVLTPRSDTVHVISLRRANPREVNWFEAQDQQ
jgi:uncharacterized protein